MRRPGSKELVAASHAGVGAPCSARENGPWSTMGAVFGLAPSDRSSPEQWRVRAQACGTNLRADRKLEPRPSGDLLTGCLEERRAEAERYRATHDSEAKVEEVRHGGDRPSDKGASSLHHRSGRFTRRAPGALGDRCS